MKKAYMLLLVFVGFFTSCGVQTEKIGKIQDSKIVLQSKPKHLGPFVALTYSVYDVDAYKRSVAFKATNKLVHPSEAHIFDLDSDGKFDTVFVLEQGTWLYGITQEFRNRNRVNEPTLSDPVTNYWIQGAVICKKNLALNTKSQVTPENKSVSATRTEVKNPQPTRWWAPFPSS